MYRPPERVRHVGREVFWKRDHQQVAQEAVPFLSAVGRVPVEVDRHVHFGMIDRVLQDVAIAAAGARAAPVDYFKLGPVVVNGGCWLVFEDASRCVKGLPADGFWGEPGL